MQKCNRNSGSLTHLHPKGKAEDVTHNSGSMPVRRLLKSPPPCSAHQKNVMIVFLALFDSQVWTEPMTNAGSNLYAGIPLQCPQELIFLYRIPRR